MLTDFANFAPVHVGELINRGLLARLRPANQANQLKCH